jgi:hypothetical protein
MSLSQFISRRFCRLPFDVLPARTLMSRFFSQFAGVFPSPPHQPSVIHSDAIKSFIMKWPLRIAEKTQKKISEPSLNYVATAKQHNRKFMCGTTSQASVIESIVLRRLGDEYSTADLMGIQIGIGK